MALWSTHSDAVFNYNSFTLISTSTPLGASGVMVSRNTVKQVFPENLTFSA